MWQVWNVDMEEFWSPAYSTLLDANAECKRQERVYGWEFNVMRVEGPSKNWWM